MLNKSSRTQRAGLIFLISFILMTVFRMILPIFYSKMTGNQATMVFTLFTQIICMGIIPFGLYILLLTDKNGEKNRFKQAMSNMKYDKFVDKKALVLILLLCVTFYFFTNGVSFINAILLQLFNYKTAVYAPTIFNGVGDLFKWLFFIAVLPSIFEELLHRGILLSAFREYGDKFACFMSAFIFGLMHQNIMQFMYAFAGGYIMAILVIKSGSIYSGMLLHFAVNAGSVILQYSSQTGGILSKIQKGMISNPLFLLVYVGVLFVMISVTYFVVINFNTVKDKLFLGNLQFKELNRRLDFDKPSQVCTLSANSSLVAIMLLGIGSTLLTYFSGVLR